MKNNKKGFTLIELLTVIALISIMMMGISKISFKKNIDRDQLDVFTNHIYNNIEEIRNSSLLGKSMGLGLITPDNYKLEINTANSGTLNTYYSSGGVLHNLHKIEANGFQSIDYINCDTLKYEDPENIDKLDIFFQGDNLTLSGCTEDAHKVIKIGIKYKNITRKIELNEVSGLINIITD